MSVRQPSSLSASRFAPVYDNGQISIYHGDCREVLPTLKADVLVTDPPYGTGYYETDKAVMTGPLLREWIGTYAAVAVFGWPEWLVGLCGAAGVVPAEWVTWWPDNARMRGFNQVGLWREVECIAVFGACDWGALRQPRRVTTTPLPNPHARGVPQNEDARMGDVWTEPSPNLNPNQPKRLHPNEKNVATMRRLLTAMPPGVAVDPFAGSGSTLVAAAEMGRSAIGIEIDVNHCATAAGRFAQGMLNVA